ncbi:MAG TPA: bifunctional tetrahydrofolate synthase/dihydrofolate synthase [Steroidobacteraceae bacterium]|nr:bifunctional tetrahydrofolate synthase/dihydrofolate synthase [Steroidobacteraceae bacterium]
MQRSLAEWLTYQERIHPRAMDLTLDRIRIVLERLGVQRPRVPVITVGGTNGKGSVTAMLEAMLRAAGRRVGLYTSPHLVRYQERIRIGGEEIDAAWLLDIFERVEAARGEVTLTFFEYATAAALAAFRELEAEILVLEVGLGGRFDAVNAVDPDVAVVTSVGLDHCEYLGTTLEAIGREKAGIFRAGRAAIYGSLAMPDSIGEEAARLGARLERLGRDFDFEPTIAGFDWRRDGESRTALPPPALVGPVQYTNAATALAALAAGGWLPGPEACAAGLRAVQLPGRFQLLPGPVEWVFDVAHNPDSAAALAATMRERPPAGRWLMVVGVLADKDAAGIGRALAPALRPADRLRAVTLPGDRGRSAAALAQLLGPAIQREVAVADSVEAGCAAAARDARPGDRVLVFGSFQTVGPALEWHRLYCPQRR